MADGAGRRHEVLLGFGERRQVVDRSLKLGAYKNASESRVSYEHRMCKDNASGARCGDVDADCCRIPREHASRHYSAEGGGQGCGAAAAAAIATQQFQGKLIYADATTTMKQLHSTREMERGRRRKRMGGAAWHRDEDGQGCKAISILPLLLILIIIISKHLVYLQIFYTPIAPSRLLAFAHSEGVGPKRGGGESPSIQFVIFSFPSRSLASRDISCFKVAFRITKGENRATEVTY